MPKKERVTISVDSVDDLFKTDEQREDDLRERVIEIPLGMLYDLDNGFTRLLGHK